MCVSRSEPVPERIKYSIPFSFIESGKPVLGQLVDSNYLLDFDIFHVSAVTELLHYIDPKYLSSDLGGSNGCQVDAWINTQYMVDQFTVR